MQLRDVHFPSDQNQTQTDEKSTPGKWQRRQFEFLSTTLWASTTSTYHIANYVHVKVLICEILSLSWISNLNQSKHCSKF